MRAWWREWGLPVAAGLAVAAGLYLYFLAAFAIGIAFGLG